MSFHGTSTSSLVQNRFSTMRLRSFRWSRLKASVSRGSVAETRLIGTVTRPKLIEPFHSARGAMSLEGCNRYATGLVQDLDTLRLTVRLRLGTAGCLTSPSHRRS